MKKSNLFRNYAIILFSLLIIGCKKEKKTDDYKWTLTPQALHINKFIWNSMHKYYLWVDDVPNLSSGAFSEEKNLDAFLNKYISPDGLFNDLLYKYTVVDKWSSIVSDYTTLEQQLQGVTKSMGYAFGLVRFTNSDGLFGYVKYVVKGGPADLKGIKRGDFFIKINGVELSIYNYQDLLFGQNSYTIDFAYNSGTTIIPNGRRLTLIAVEVQENPIFLYTVFTIDGVQTGYLIYNQFSSNYDYQLNNVFLYFKEQGVQQLILDLRYNAGGYLQSVISLASMIYSTDASKVLFENRFNSHYQAYMDSVYGPEYSKVKFTNKIDQTDSSPEVPVNSLNLNKVCIITTGNTASASEVLITGLRPYINVITVGTSTYGKYEGPLAIIKDYNDAGVLNTDHKWAVLPIVMKYANSAGLSDYYYGLAPTDSIMEDIVNMFTLGDTKEPLLKKAINCISGSNKKATLSASKINFIEVADSKDFLPHSKEMFIDLKTQTKKGIKFY